MRNILKIFKSQKITSNYDMTRDRFTNDNILKCIIAYNKYGGYCVPSSCLHRPVAQKILNGEIWEPETIRFMVSNCGNGDIIHTGTFFGDFLPALSRGISSNAKVWAFEPNVENFKCTFITKYINSIDNVKLFNFGVGKEKKITKMMIADRAGIPLGGKSKIVDNNFGKGTFIKIKIKTLDEIIPKNRHISIIQLDVEGYEKQALIGATDTIIRCKPILILEDNNNVIATEWFSNNILSQGYKISGKVHDNTVFTIS